MEEEEKCMDMVALKWTLLDAYFNFFGDINIVRETGQPAPRSQD